MERDKTSLLYWYPIIKDIALTPRTEIVMLNEKELNKYWRGEGDACSLGRLTQEVKKVIKAKFTLPVFIKTDVYSDKHNWKNSCYVDSLDNLDNHLFEIIAGSRCADILGGLPIEAIIVREFIPMKTLFKAFWGEMPVNPEIRVFIKNGKIICHHWYWIEEAIEDGTDEESLPANWKEILDDVKYDYANIDYILSIAEQIAKKLAGFWSIDFCLSKDDKWILIDMAEGSKSWHDRSCEKWKLKK